MSQEPFLIDLDKVLETKAPKLAKRIPKFVVNHIKRKVHVDELNHILTIFADKKGVDFMNSVVDYFGLSLEVKGLENIPDDGRYIFASNHPLGGLDGICLSSIIGNKYKKKVKYIVNDILYYIENLKPIFLPINKHGAQARQAMLETANAFSSDNQIITFPAGMCSRKQKGQIVDLEWKKSFIQKAIESERDIVPIYFEAKNSNFFYKFANIRKRLGIKFNIEMIFLPDEMFKNKGQTFSITFGKPIPYSTFDKSKNANQWADYVKDIAYNLKTTDNNK